MARQNNFRKIVSQQLLTLTDFDLKMIYQLASTRTLTMLRWQCYTVLFYFLIFFKSTTPQPYGMVHTKPYHNHTIPQPYHTTTVPHHNRTTSQAYHTTTILVSLSLKVSVAFKFRDETNSRFSTMKLSLPADSFVILMQKKFC